MKNPTPKEIRALLVAVNSTENFFKYPIGNKELTEKLKTMEDMSLIKFNSFSSKWERS